MHKPLERFYNYLVKITDRKVNKMDAENKKREENRAEIYPDELDYDESLLQECKKLGLPPLDAKNPYRFL